MRVLCGVVPAGHYEASCIERQAAAEPFRIGFGADHYENVADHSRFASPVLRLIQVTRRKA